MTLREEIDPLAPQREAALFYGLFLRGQAAEEIRREIEIPPAVLKKMLTNPQYEGSFRDNVRKMYSYRKQVLAIFDELVQNQKIRSRIQ
jgi:alkyl sulfatase BDS1-like metallo-beta-lactamase superfamily hydrolase